jgi:hypothetical protein
MEEEKISLFTKTVTKVFGPILQPIFSPINNFLASHYTPWATICALSLFIGAMIWAFTLRREYVNVDAPSKSFLYDLRFWTVLSMLPHVLVYLYFAKWS